MGSKYNLFFILVILLLIGCSETGQGTRTADSRLIDTLADKDTDGYSKALHPVNFRFPQDHGAHRDFRTEWWYFTGNLVTESGRQFGYQFTIFRNAVSAVAPDLESAWATNQVYLAHTALSDIEAGRFYHDEQYAREALGLAGTTDNPFSAWVSDWSVRQVDDSDGADLAVKITVVTDEFKLNLELVAVKPAVFHGNRGLSAKSLTAGNASYYYSYTRMLTGGEIETAGKIFPVTGESWFDHEWSTSALEPDQAGWDWFSLQFSNDTELMAFRLRHKTDAEKDFYSGTFVHEDGSLEAFERGDFAIRETGSWRSRLTGIRYPSGWKIQIPRRNLDIQVKVKMPNQEMSTGFRYWEGAVTTNGLVDGVRASGKGYVELTGYR